MVIRLWTKWLAKSFQIVACVAITAGCAVTAHDGQEAVGMLAEHSPIADGEAKILQSWQGDYPLKKSVFFRAGASAILQVNESILNDRQQLSNLKLGNMSQKERQWVNQMMSTYRVTEEKASFTDDQLAGMTSVTYLIGGVINGQ